MLIVYEVTADGAKKSGCYLGRGLRGLGLKDQNSEGYAISDVELDEKTVTEDKDDASTTTDGGKKNPDTGR